MSSSKRNPLSGASDAWAELRSEFDKAGAELEDGAAVKADEIKKRAHRLQHTVTKLGATAAVASGPEDPGVVAVAADAVESYTAALGTLLACRKGAGPSLSGELKKVAADLSTALVALGAAIGTASMAMCTGKVLEKVEQLEKVPIHNKAAIRKRILLSLAQARDASKELETSLKTGGEKGDDEADEDLDDDSFLDDELEPGERRVVEAVQRFADAVQEVLKQASMYCSPKPPPQSDASTPALSIAALEEVATLASQSTKALDGLICHCTGGFDEANFSASLVEAEEVVRTCAGFATVVGGDPVVHRLQDGLESMREAARTVEQP